MILKPGAAALFIHIEQTKDKEAGKNSFKGF